MDMLKLSCAVAMVLGTAAPWCAAQGGGLRADPAASDWPRWQGRLSIDVERSDSPASDAGGIARGARALGDYYITSPFHGGNGGLRATSGLILSSRAQAAQPLNSALAGRGFNAERRLGAAMAPSWIDADSSTVPYLGLGYTGVVARSGFSFSADLGVMALNTGAKVRFGNRSASQQSADDLARELRLSPILSLGVSYAF